MLRLPSTGVAKSVTEHNGVLSTQADWIESSLLFENDTVSRSDVVDVLTENNVYREQGFANVWVSNLFTELDRRLELLGDAGCLKREGARYRRIRPWTERPAYSFCVALSAVVLYRSDVEKKLGKKYADQGELFELLCVEALVSDSWLVHRTGWSKAATKTIEAKISALASALGESANITAIPKWTAPCAKDSGLDIVAWIRYPDGWGGRPVCLIQCASGQGWKEKLCTPNLKTWKKLIDFSTCPLRGLAMPFAPDVDEFRLASNHDGLMLLLDRHRLLCPAGNATWSPSAGLASDLVQWTAKRVAAFPTDS